MPAGSFLGKPKFVTLADAMYSRKSHKQWKLVRGFDIRVVSENNILIKQIEWDVMPINFLSRTALQYSKSIDDVERFLKEQKVYPARLLFVSSKKSASIFEMANREMARIKMKDGYLAMANHTCTIPSKNVSIRTWFTQILKFYNFYDN